MTKKEDTITVLDKLLSDIDAEVLLAGALGAVAASGGITPPLTRILMVFSEGVNVDLGAANAAASTWYDVAKWGSPLAFILGPDVTFGEKKDPETVIKMRALMASGALEAMMMMSLAKNPGAIEAIGNAVAKAGGAAAALL